MNWTYNCSLYNTLVLVVYIILLSERGSECWSRGIRWDYLAFLAHVGRVAFGGTLVAGRSATRTLDGIRGNVQQRERWMEYAGTNSVLVEFEL